MNTALPEKWIEGVAPGERPGDVAARTLQNRLGAVLHYLPLAAERPDEGDYIHELRVWTRRATAALDLYEDLIPRRRYSWMKTQLRRVRRAANDARDCDVLIKRLKKKSSGRGAKRWLEEVRAEREEAQTAVQGVYQRLERDHRFSRRVDELLPKVHARASDIAAAGAIGFGDWARQRLHPIVEQFFAAVPADQRDAAALHQLRIRGKELRYAMELLGSAFPEAFRTSLYPAIEALQDRLGDVNDLASARSRLQRKLETSGTTAESAPWRRLMTSGNVQLERALQEFWEWCTPQMLDELRDAFESLLGQRHQRVSDVADRLEQVAEALLQSARTLRQSIRGESPGAGERG